MTAPEYTASLEWLKRFKVGPVSAYATTTATYEAQTAWIALSQSRVIARGAGEDYILTSYGQVYAEQRS